MKTFVEGKFVMECLMADVNIVYPLESRYFQLLAFFKRQLQDESRIYQQICKRASRTPLPDANIFLKLLTKVQI